jgi:alcohol dehydrogenase (cytochrome c)
MQQTQPGQEIFRTRCASCHGTTGNGGEFAPSIVARVPLRSDEELVHLLHDGLPNAGMQAFSDIEGQDRDHLLRFLRTLQPNTGLAAAQITVKLESGKTLSGTALNRSSTDLQLLDEQQRLHLLRKTAKDTYRTATSGTAWTSYNGSGRGDRYSSLTQITPANAHTLQPRWIFDLTGTHSLQTTPVIADGVMYVTSANECYALDAGSGRQIWHWQRQRTPKLIGVGAGGANRGAAISGDRVFMATDNAHLVALDRSTGKLLWETTMADWHQNYNGTGAPLPVGDMVVAGIAGGGRWSARLHRRLRAGYRQGAVAHLDRAPTRRARQRDLEGRRHRSP